MDISRELLGRLLEALLLTGSLFYLTLFLTQVGLVCAVAVASRAGKASAPMSSLYLSAAFFLSFWVAR